ncbi:MAG: HU family DNA-binding protein [Bacteroidetes bacterium]|nr:HU family DNA-binding protein [Bacteroidota bacterium]
MSSKRNGSEFIDIFANRADISKKDARSFIEAFSDIITEVAISEGKANVSGFGSFTVTEVADREGTQPGTGETIIIPAHRRMSFSPYKKLEETVNNTSAEEEHINENTPSSTEKGHNTTMKTESNAFAALLDEIESQAKQQSKATKDIPDTAVTPATDTPRVAKKPTEFVPPELESQNSSEELEQKAALLDELEELIKQKKELLLQKPVGSSLDVSIQDDEQTEARSDEQIPSSHEENKPQKSKKSKFLDAFSSKKSTVMTSDSNTDTSDEATESANSTSLKNNLSKKSSQEKQYVSVDEELLIGLIGSMDELQQAISSLNAKSKQLSNPATGVIQFDRTWFLSGGFIGAIVLFISGFFLGNTMDLINPSINTSVNPLSSTATVTAAEANETPEVTESEEIPTIINETEGSLTNAPVSNNTATQATNNSGTIRFDSTIGLYNMADQIYGNPRLWVLLFEENFSTAQNPDDIPDNTVLNIPRIGQNGSLTPLERERLRIALLHVAQAYENAGKPSLALSYRNASNYYPNTM